MKNIWRIFRITFLICSANASFAHANAGVPMIAFYLPSAWLSLIPIIFIEALVGVKKYSLEYKPALISVSVANAVSTLVGIPLTWLIWASIEGAFFGGVLGSNPVSWGVLSVTVQAAWLLPYEDHLWWMGLVACFFLSVVFYVVSITVEYQIVSVFFKNHPKKNIWSWIVRSNLYTYSLLFLVASLLFTFNQELGSIIRLFDPVVYLFWEVVASISNL